jgi:glyoxylase-like metal-dependent hydrolase (beta-lactamase superfamily II)
MKMTLNKSVFYFTLVIFLSGCSQTEEVIIVQQKTGYINTNCYLVYGEKSREAALIDVGGPVDTLLALIKVNKLNLKYVFITHCHQDHVDGLPRY